MKILYCRFYNNQHWNKDKQDGLECLNLHFAICNLQYKSTGQQRSEQYEGKWCFTPSNHHHRELNQTRARLDPIRSQSVAGRLLSSILKSDLKILQILHGMRSAGLTWARSITDNEDWGRAGSQSQLITGRCIKCDFALYCGCLAWLGQLPFG